MLQGETTRQLLAAQAAGTMAGPPRPMVGAAATLSWQRYLDSFGYAIPEWFEEKVEDGGSQ